MLPLFWLPEARQDLHEIIDYISDRNPAAAGRIGDRIEHAADRLPDHPYIHPLAAFPAPAKR